MAVIQAPSLELARLASRPTTATVLPSGKKNNARKVPGSVRFQGSPKYPRVAAPPTAQDLDPYQVLRYPLTTESAVTMMERDNTLTFVVDARADKTMIKGAIRGLLGVEARRVNTLVRPDGTKKAYVKLAPGFAAADVVGRMGMS